MASGRFLSIGLILVVGVLAVAWNPSPAMRAAIGWFLLVTSSAALVFMLVKRRALNAAAPSDPRWVGPLGCVGLFLMGIENVWPQYPVSKFGVAVLLVTMVPQLIGLIREWDSDSVAKNN